MTRPAPKPWVDCFPKLTNGELRGLYRAGFANATQLEIVLYILTQTRGTGRIMAGEVDADGGWDEWQEALSEYGREVAPLFRGSIAAAVRRDESHVVRQLRKLIAAGVVIEHEPGHKGKAASLSVDLDPEHWRPSALRRAPKRFPMVNTPPKQMVNTPPKAPDSMVNTPPALREESKTEDLCSCEQETWDSGESHRVHERTITTPEIQELQRLLTRDHEESP